MNMSKSRDIQAIMPSPVSSVFIITEPFFPHYYIIHLCKKIVTGYCPLRSQQHALQNITSEQQQRIP